MKFREAAAFVLPFGKYKGWSLDDTAKSDAGLFYLDWLYGERVKQREAATLLRDPLDMALRAYLTDPGIASDLRKLVGDDDD